ncbi:MAG: hypothetical protein K2N03_04270 [Muribaculaceae bacterium]|nr:hypothetical protein [Muribaculaceae bacterium]
MLKIKKLLLLSGLLLISSLICNAQQNPPYVYRVDNLMCRILGDTDEVDVVHVETYPSCDCFPYGHLVDNLPENVEINGKKYRVTPFPDHFLLRIRLFSLRR